MSGMILLYMALAFLMAQNGTASIEGIVVKMGSGEPIAGSKVTLDPSGPIDPSQGPIPCPIRTAGEPPEGCLRLSTATTGADGRFVLSGIAPGSYRLIATRSGGGFVPGEYGQRSPTGEGISFNLAAGQRMMGVQLAMSPTGSISGRVVDIDGEPLGKAQVFALRSIYRDGARRMTIVQAVQTNDRGEYRLFWLPPGNYYVSARRDTPTLQREIGPLGDILNPVRVTEPVRFGSFEQANAPVIKKRILKTGETVEESSVPVYYPGVADAQSAAPVALASGATIGGVDVSIAAGVVATHHIRGRAIDGKTGQPLAKAGISAIPRKPEPLLSVPSGQTDANGLFDLPGAIPGSYILVLQNGGGSGIVNLEVGNRDLENIAIVSTPGFKLSGRFIIEGRSPNGTDPKIANLRVAQLVRDPNFIGMPSTGPSYNPPPSEDGSFYLEGVAVGDFRVQIRGLGTDSYVKSIRMGNADVLDAGLHIQGPPQNPLEIVIGADAGRIQGSVVNSRQENLANRIVVLVPDLRLRQRSDLYKMIATDSSGQFRLQGIPPGNYKLFAWEQVEGGAWQDPEFIRNFEDRGKTISVREGNNENVQLTVIP